MKIIILLIAICFAAPKPYSNQDYLNDIKLSERHRLIHRSFKDLVNQEFEKTGTMLRINKCYKDKYPCEIHVLKNE